MRHLVLHVVTPLHVGVGQGIGGVDLPIARERATGLPYIPGSTLKGCLRASLGESPAVPTLFGGEPGAVPLVAGAVYFGDAHLVAMPVRHATKVFVWITAPHVLRTARRLGLDLPVSTGPTAPLVLENDAQVSATPASEAVVQWIAAVTGHDLAWVKERVYEVSDDDFAWACEFATQIDVRNRIGLETGVVVDGALWSEESLAPESLLVAPLDARTADVDLAPLAVESLALGGKGSIGRGVCRVSLSERGAA